MRSSHVRGAGAAVLIALFPCCVLFDGPGDYPPRDADAAEADTSIPGRDGSPGGGDAGHDAIAPPPDSAPALDASRDAAPLTDGSDGSDGRGGCVGPVQTGGACLADTECCSGVCVAGSRKCK